MGALELRLSNHLCRNRRAVRRALQRWNILLLIVNDRSMRVVAEPLTVLRNERMTCASRGDSLFFFRPTREYPTGVNGVQSDGAVSLTHRMISRATESGSVYVSLATDQEILLPRR